MRDDLQKNCSLPELREMLEDNGLSSQGGESSVSLEILVMFQVDLKSKTAKNLHDVNTT